MSNFCFDDDFECSFKDQKLIIRNLSLDMKVDWNNVTKIGLYNIKFDIDSLLYGSFNLKKVTIKMCNLKSLDCLEKNRNLKSLIIKDNKSTLPMKGISSFTNLDILILESTHLGDYAEIFDTLSLIKLDISRSNLEDLDRLDNLIRLEKIWLSMNKIRDISTFENIGNDKFISVSNNPVDVRTANLYKVNARFVTNLENYQMIKDDEFSVEKVRFENYKKRILLSYKYPLLKIKVRNMWFSFFEGKRNADNYNRLSYFFSSF